ncbi:MAG TPA: secretin N-terminal domain-containing protein [Armatimonadota bacterium]|nr:secretin N-terminal domain-containing protein [Armatimonadota bacterium]
MKRLQLTLVIVVLFVGVSALVAWGQGAAPAGDAPEQIEVPFAAPGGAPAPAAPPIPADPETVEVSIAFTKADLANVLNFLSMASGIPIVMDADVKGTVTITSMHKVKLPLAYEVINAALRVRGYTMVGTLKDKLIRVVPLKKSIADKATVQMGADPATLGDSDMIVTQVIPVTYISAAKLQAELKPLVADDQANLLAVSSSNTLIVTDTEGNVRRLMQIISLLDKDTSDVLDVEVYLCQYASARVLITSLEKVFGAATPTVQPRPGQPNQPNQPNQPGQPRVATDDGVLSLRGELKLSADERTNAIIISASKERIKMVIGLISKLDINTTPEVRTKTYRLQYADATNVASQLNTLFQQPQGGLPSRNPWTSTQQRQLTATEYAGLKQNVVVADVRTNAVVATATEQNLREFDKLIEELDAPNVLSDVTRTFQLKFAKASTVSQTMMSLFRGSGSRMNFWDVVMGSANANSGDPIASLRRITVVADDKTNTLLVTGPPQSFSMVESIIEQLDRRTPQVFIQVAIVDVTLDDSTKFGVEWNWANDPHGVNHDPTKHDVKTAFSLAEEKLGMKYSVISANLQSLLHALTTRSNVKVYSTPSITTADNVPATISIGQDVPFVSSSEQTSNGNLRQTVEFKNVSISLNVTPRISQNSNMISLDVQQTINELIGRVEELNAPIIANRQAKKTVMVNDGQTIVIGGIIKQNTENVNSGVPVLSKLPLLGGLFKSRANKAQQSELMVFLTPHILRDEESVTAITEQERAKLSDTPAAPAPPNAPAAEAEKP